MYRIRKLPDERVRQPKTPQPQGFTLLEVLLVLAILVVIATMATMSLRGSLRHHRLMRAAEQLQTEWARARVAAIKKGRVQVFRYALLGRDFVVHAEASLDEPTSSDYLVSTSGSALHDGATAGSVAAPGTVRTNATDAVPHDEAHPRQLPLGVTFLTSDVQVDSRSALHMTQLGTQRDMASAFAWQGPTGEGEGLQPSNSNGSANWGMPIYFFPDGTSSTATVYLQNDQEQRVALRLRGLTGNSHISTRLGTSEDLSGATR